MQPIHLAANQPPDRFYRGGEKIAAFRGLTRAAPRTPEDWVASATTLHGEQSLGLTTLPGGTVLREAMKRHPLDWFGPEHVERFGADPMILTKLLDAGERLPVHVHPDGAFAAAHLHTAHGKAEAWIILEPGTVRLGFSRNIGTNELRSWIDTQDTDAMLAAMHVLDVRAGDAVFVPPGLPHAIGAGIFLIEVQEPEDLSILLEWKNFAIDGPAEGHLGLGFDTAADAVDRHGWSASAIESLVSRGVTSGQLLPESSRQYFSAERIRVGGSVELPAGFSVLVVLRGAGVLSAGVLSQGAEFPLAAGETLVVPHAAGPLHVAGDLELVRLSPPAA